MPSNITRPWDHPAIMAAFKRLWAEGLSGSEVAAQLNIVAQRHGVRHRFTRNSVIGKSHRLGVQRGNNNYGNPPKSVLKAQAERRKARAEAKRAASGKPKPASEPLPQIFDFPVPAHKRVGIEGLEPDQCRWPIGDPMKADFHFCDQEAAPGLSYCQHHVKRAYIAVPPKKKRAQGDTSDFILPTKRTQKFFEGV